MTVREVAEPLARWTGGGERAGVATLVRVRRSAPRRPGARFAVSEGGEIAGSVSSGCVEGDLFEHLQRVLREGVAEVVHYGITDEMAAEVGLACGGEIDVLVAPHEPGSLAWASLRRAVQAADPAVLVTGISGPVRARTLLVRPDGTREGTLGSAALDDEAAEAALPLFETGGTDVARVSRPEGEEVELFLEAFLPPPRMAIVGATPVAAALSRFAATLGFAVTVIDPREAFAAPERFPDAGRVLHAWPEEGLEEIGLDRYVDVVVLAHDLKLDVPALAAALRAGCRYVGQIGGRRTQGLRREALAEAGFDEEALSRIHGPVGLDIGAETPEEIALSIMAEVVAVRHGR